MVSSVPSTADQLLTALLERSFQRGLAGFASPALAGFDSRDDGTAGLSAKELVAVLGGARSNLLDLSLAAARLDAANPLSAFFTGAATTTDPDAVMARVVPGTSTATASASGSYSVTVGQLAVAQVNTGTALLSAGPSAFTAGINTVRFTQNGTTTDVSFGVGSSDTNATVLSSFADAVNATSGLGVTAAVVTDAGAGTSTLVLSATTTGTAAAFTVANVSGNPVTKAYLGSSGQVHLTLVGTTATPVVVSVGPDTKQVAAAVTGFVNAFNAAHAFFAANPDLVSGAAPQLESVLMRSSARLQAIGIDVASDGSLSVDPTRLSASLADGVDTVRAVLGDVGGFAKEVHAIADTQLALPSVARDPSPVYRPGASAQALAGLMASALNDLAVRGMLVDALI